MKKTAVILFALSCSIAAIAQNRTGEVSGFVVDSQGDFVAGATIRAHYVDGPVFGAVPESQTDQTGHFTLSNVSLGGYVLIAMKEDDGYPDAFWSFYHPRQSTRVTLSGEAPKVDSIRLMLEPKAAVVVGTVSDAVSGEPLSAVIHMWRADKENDYVDQGVSGDYRILVPADTDVRISIRSPGHQQSRTASLVISGGHREQLHVKLARAAQ
jgi:hypothetical protein